METAHPGKCFDKLTRKALLPDKEYKPKGICAAMTCSLEAREISIETCPYVEAPGCEELPSDPYWRFPKCCPQFKSSSVVSIFPELFAHLQSTDLPNLLSKGYSETIATEWDEVREIYGARPTPEYPKPPRSRKKQNMCLVVGPSIESQIWREI
ncbi:GM24717 [Drosophila sechellia]|uniref:GM24717 n=1 Tax=Drosophila sechellia TaxID=7238 RepID=B4HEX9_DROSE|nr:GM24717 [Drosophila sechellia]